jgi:hypothetical protein
MPNVIGYFSSRNEPTICHWHSRSSPISARGKVAALTLISLFWLFEVSAAAQAKQQPSRQPSPQDSGSWHRQVIKDEIDGDRVAYYLPTLEEKTVWLIVVCPGSKPGFASLQFRFQLYGTTTSNLKYKTANGEVIEAEFALTDRGDAMVAGDANKFRSLVGSTIRVEDSAGNLHTYHLPTADTVPFDKGCTDEHH